MAAAGDQPHAVAVALHPEAVAVIFDFVEPLCTGGHGLPTVGYRTRTDAWFRDKGPAGSF